MEAFKINSGAFAKQWTRPMQNNLLVYLIVMAHLTGHRLDGLCYKSFAWFYVNGQQT